MLVCEGGNTEQPFSGRILSGAWSRMADALLANLPGKGRRKLFFYGKEIQSDALGSTWAKLCQCLPCGDAQPGRGRCGRHANRGIANPPGSPCWGMGSYLLTKRGTRVNTAYASPRRAGSGSKRKSKPSRAKPARYR